MKGINQSLNAYGRNLTKSVAKLKRGDGENDGHCHESPETSIGLFRNHALNHIESSSSEPFSPFSKTSTAPLKIRMLVFNFRHLINVEKQK